MADPRFYDNKGPLAAKDLVRLSGAVLAKGADPAKLFHDVAPLAMAGPGHVSFIEGAKHRPALSASLAGGICLTENDLEHAPRGAIGFVSEKPLLAYAQIARAFYPGADGISAPTAGFNVHPTAVIEEGVALERFAVIGAGAVIGRNTRIGANSVIGRGVVVGRDCIVGPNVSIGFALLGDRVIVHAGARIGQDGFGFTPGPRGHFKIPQLGRVIVQDDAEIGAGTCIDRGSAADTVIGEGTKIDNLVQIGHNVVTGRGCIIVSQVGLSGSITLGDFVVLGGKVGVADHVSIGDRAMVAARSGVTNTLPGGAAYGGFPARPIMEWRREVAALARLAREKRKTS